jgi:KUP system potassium uptake protein
MATNAHGAATPSTPHSIRIAAVLGALGVVFGDIGTSPLYALKEAATAASHSGGLTSDSVLGVLSLILWSLIVVISIKYCTFILRADNHGEGGIIALLALLGSAGSSDHSCCFGSPCSGCLACVGCSKPPACLPP